MKQLLSLVTATLGSALMLAVGTEAQGASALDFKFTSALSDENYQKLVEPIVTPMKFMFVMPAKGLGLIPGIDVSLAGTALTLPSTVTDVAKVMIEKGDSLPKTLFIPRLIAQKGLPFGLDISVNASMIPTTQIKLYGIAAQYNIDPIPLVPVFVGIRGGYSALAGLDALSSSHINFEGVVSAGLPAVIPFIDVQPWVGVGMDMAKASSTFTIETVEVSRSSDWTENYAMAGLRVGLFAIKVAAEVQWSMSGKPAQYTGKIGLAL